MYSMDCVDVDDFNREIRCTLHFLLYKKKKFGSYFSNY